MLSSCTRIHQIFSGRPEHRLLPREQLYRATGTRLSTVHSLDHNAARQPQKRLGISGLSIDARIRTHELIATCTSLMRTSHYQRNLPSWTRTASSRQRLGQSPHRSSGAALKSSSARWILLKVCFLHSYSDRRLVMYEFDPVSFSF